MTPSLDSATNGDSDTPPLPRRILPRREGNWLRRLRYVVQVFTLSDLPLRTGADKQELEEKQILTESDEQEQEMKMSRTINFEVRTEFYIISHEYTSSLHPHII
ncbi:hypothetical protein SDJN03_21296, partial [Cucurbita argyrosperma subsp. sororia]